MAVLYQLDIPVALGLPASERKDSVLPTLVVFQYRQYFRKGIILDAIII